MATAKKATEKETKTTKAAKTEVKAAEPKAAAKTTKVKAAKAVETTETVIIEFAGKSINVKDVVEAVKAAYKADGNEDAIETVNVYVQPENGVAYYVVNGKEEGKCVNC